MEKAPTATRKCILETSDCDCADRRKWFSGSNTGDNYNIDQEKTRTYNNHVPDLMNTSI